MQRIWKNYAKVLVKKHTLWAVILVVGMGDVSSLTAETVKLMIENKSFDTDKVQAPHVFFANNTSPEPASLFLIPEQGEVVRKNLDQKTLIAIFRNPSSWQAYLKVVPNDSMDGKAVVLFKCTMNKIHLKGQDVRELKITVTDQACDVTISSD